MERPLPVIDADPLRRFLDVNAALEEDRRWSEGALPLRFAASTLVTAPGEPAEVAVRVREMADELKERAGWFGVLRSSIRFLVAAMLYRDHLDATTFNDLWKELDDGLNQRGLSRGHSHAVLSALILLRAGDGTIDRDHLDRMAEVFRGMKEHHPWITNRGDYAPCALLATTGATVPEMMQRIEAIYDGLRERGFSRGDKLQRASHLLFFSDEADQILVDRFAALWAAFEDAGLWMHQGDYDETAILAFLAGDPGEVTRTVLKHRESIAALRPRPGKEVSFTLACGTGFLELARGAYGDVADTSRLVQLQSLLDAQSAALIASTAASTAASASSAG